MNAVVHTIIALVYLWFISSEQNSKKVKMNAVTHKNTCCFICTNYMQVILQRKVRLFGLMAYKP